MTTEQAQGPATILGHSGAISFLDRSIETGRLSHAYILVGPRHVGKMAVAIFLAKAVNCQGEGKHPCDVCPQCRRTASGQHTDVQVIDISGEEGGQDRTRIGIGRIRELKRQASLHPYEGTYRVFIVDGAEFLTLEAANALLKSLEEPPPAVLLVLLTADETAVLPTVLSRCQRIELWPMPIEELAKALVDRYSADEAKAELLARLSGGCPGWAISAAQEEKVLNSRLEALDGIIGLADLDLQGRFRYAAELASLYSKDRQSGREILGLWLSWWRDLILMGEGVGDLATNLHRRDELKDHSLRYPLEEIGLFIQRITNAREYLDRNANARLVLEWLALRMPLARSPEASESKRSLAV